MNADRLIRRHNPWIVGAALLLLSFGVGCSSDGDDVMQSGDVWELRGPLLAWDGEVWLVDDQPLIVPAGVHAGTPLILGATVEANGTIDEAGRRVTEKIEISDGAWPDSSLPGASIQGTVERVDDSALIVDGTEVIVPAGARVHGAASDSLLSDGNEVTIEGYRLDDDRLLAVEVYFTAAPPVDDNDQTSDSLDTRLPPTISSTHPSEKVLDEPVSDSIADDIPQQGDDGSSDDSDTDDKDDKDDKKDKAKGREKEKDRD